jgi:osmotically-inducible protein OsmY
MRKYGKWALTLGLMAATPGLSLAAPWSRTQAADAGGEKTEAASRPSGKSHNQEMADKIAVSLRNARLQGYDIEIEFKDGTATLKGRVTDPKQKDKATQVIQKIPGVERVDNQLVLAPKPSATQRMSAGSIQQASHTSAGPQSERVQQINHAQYSVTTGGHNQVMAQQVADALTAAQLDGFDIEIRYEDGAVTLSGTVETNAQRQAAGRVASQVAGVTSVTNLLRPTREPLAPQSPHAGMPHAGMPIHPAAYQAGGMPPAPGAPLPMAAYGHGGPGAAPAVYNLPSMPDYAWPAYAQYPNSAAVTYPSQYSPSAWPYIGPFYPYPQVPLGWRDATLRWDDGYWSLQFRQRTDKWWWFFNPKNW